MSKIKITDENSNHANFTILQNILSHIGLNAFERSLYWAIREVAGDRRSCTKSIAELAKMSGMSEKSVKRTLISLSEKNSLIEKPLIKIKHRLTESGDRDTNEIILTNLWTHNHEFFQEIIGEVCVTPPPPIKKKIGGVCVTPGGVCVTYKQDVVNINTKEQQQQTAAVFSCLENLNDPSITQKEKERISKKYSEETIKKAVKSITKKGFTPRETLLKALNAALKYEWKSDVIEDEDVKQNKMLAKKIEKLEHPYKFEALKDALHISKGTNGKTIEIKYNISNQEFVSQIEKEAKIKIK